MKPFRKISSALLFLGLVGSALAYPPAGDKPEKQGKTHKQGKQAKQQNKEQRKAEQKDQAQENKQAQRQRDQHQQAQLPQQDRPPGWDKGKKVGWGNGNVPPGKQARHSQERQQQLIREQQQRVVVYRQRLDQQQILAQQYAAQLQQDRRMAAYRYQQAYLARLRQQQAALRNTYNYNNDPYFYTAPTFSYNRDGSTYETNRYGADQLRRAINAGYSEGFRAGQADRQDRFTSGYQNSYAYQDANYGYSGYSSDQDSYNHYFRQGFGKGYEDGYNSRSQFGTVANGKYSILGNVLNAILNLQNLR